MDKKDKMDKISKQDIEKCVKNVLSQKHIPSEERMREIVKEEIERHYNKEEEIQKQPVSDKIKTLFTVENFKFLGWSVILFLFVLLDITGFKILVEGPRQIPSIKSNHIVAANVFLFLTFILTVIFISFSMKIYDIVIKKNHKIAKIVVIFSILYWSSIVFPELSKIIEKIK